MARRFKTNGEEEMMCTATSLPEHLRDTSAPAPRSDLVFSGFVGWHGVLNAGVLRHKGIR